METGKIPKKKEFSEIKMNEARRLRNWKLDIGMFIAFVLILLPLALLFESLIWIENKIRGFNEWMKK